MSAAFQVADVEELLALMEQWHIAELHLTVEDATLDLVRATPMVVEAPAPTAPAAHGNVEPEVIVEPVIISAPVVGVFHLARSGFAHGAPRVGEQVQAGQLIGNIELMHVPTDLVSPVSGTIESMLAEDGAGVEFGQPLLAIRPFEEVSEDEAGMVPPPRR